MDQISLGELQMVTPLLGHLRSTYGYRDHPVDGEYKFHNGVDIGGQEGDAIGAFADGTVDYTSSWTMGTGSSPFMPIAASCVCPKGSWWRQGRR